MRFWQWLVLGLLVVIACPVSAKTFGMKLVIIDPQTIRASLWNNNYVVPTDVKKRLFKESAKLTLKKGFTSFTMTDNQVSSILLTSGSSSGQDDQKIAISFTRFNYNTTLTLYKSNDAPTALTTPVYDAKTVLKGKAGLVTDFKKTATVTTDKTTPITTSNRVPTATTSKPSPAVARWTDKSHANLKEGNWLEAIRTASAAIELDPNYAVSYINRATAYVNFKYTDKAMLDIDQALKIAPKNAQALNIKGYLMQQSNADKQALGYYEQACMLKLEIACKNFEEIVGFRPENTLSRIHYLLGMSDQAIERQQWDKIVNYSSQVLKQAPDNAKAYSNRSGAYAALGFLKEALADANKAISLDPDYAVAYKNRGYVYQLMGDPRNAVLEYEISCNMGVKASCLELDKLKTLVNR